MKTVIVTATMAALLVVGPCATAQENEPTTMRPTGTTPGGISSAPADDDIADDSDEIEAASYETQEYGYGSHPGYYAPRGPANGFVGAYSQTNPFDASDGDDVYSTPTDLPTPDFDPDGDEILSDGRQASCCGDGCCHSCCSPFWAHKSGLFAEMLYLRPRGVDVAYAEVRNGIDPATAVPFGQVATASPSYAMGYRIGIARALNRCTSIVLSYTHYQSETDGSLFANPPLSVHSLVTLPQTFTAASDSLAALGRYNVRFQFVDLDYKRLLSGGDNWAVNYSLGTRYADLHEAFREAQPIGPGVTNVASNVNFEGLGSRIGLQGERKLRNRGFMAYGKGFASLVVGKFRSGYAQTNNFQTLQALASWDDSRAVPILEYEFGVGWQNVSGRIRFSAGYYFAAWFNTVSTNNFIGAVQTNAYNNNHSNLADTVTFDGFTGRAEIRW
ncbi:MAG TPA: Lpg1974 family pore-forming outer membrane protein [Pirellulales bacterium]|nr:Lpg1974 family pore-forming outer membrane protein [Pirellulales bacterium]